MNVNTSGVGLSVVLLLTALPTFSQSLRNNYEYVCNSERIVVGHCRNDPDRAGSDRVPESENFCTVYYPDRPKRNGFEEQTVELRTDIIKKLAACAEKQRTPSQAAKPRPSSTETATNANAGSPAIATRPRFEGLYRDTSDQMMDNWLRFYEDGAVIAVTLGRGTDPERVEQSLRKPTDKSAQSPKKAPGLYSAGKFKVEGSKIYFLLTQSDSTSASGTVVKGAAVEYSGTIYENSIRVDSHSRKTDYRGTENYKFVALPASKTP